MEFLYSYSVPQSWHADVVKMWLFERGTIFGTSIPYYDTAHSLHCIQMTFTDTNIFGCVFVQLSNFNFLSSLY